MRGADKATAPRRPSVIITVPGTGDPFRVISHPMLWAAEMYSVAYRNAHICEHSLSADAMTASSVDFRSVLPNRNLKVSPAASGWRGNCDPKVNDKSWPRLKELNARENNAISLVISTHSEVDCGLCSLSQILRQSNEIVSQERCRLLHWNSDLFLRVAYTREVGFHQGPGTRVPAVLNTLVGSQSSPFPVG